MTKIIGYGFNNMLIIVTELIINETDLKNKLSEHALKKHV